MVQPFLRDPITYAHFTILGLDSKWQESTIHLPDMHMSEKVSHQLSR
jgi:hypothetical protein